MAKIPPVTRFLCASSLVVTIIVFLQLVHPNTMLFTRELVTQNRQIWRLYTSFFLGSGGITYIFELAMLYRTAVHLESRPYARRSADFAWQLILAGACIIVTCHPLGAHIFTRPLLIALTYLSSALAPSGSENLLYITPPNTYHIS